MAEDPWWTDLVADPRGGNLVAEFQRPRVAAHSGWEGLVGNDRGKLVATDAEWEMLAADVRWEGLAENPWCPKLVVGDPRRGRLVGDQARVGLAEDQAWPKLAAMLYACPGWTRLATD